MKQITCSKMGGDSACNFVITGATSQEMIDNGWKHMGEAHPERVKQIMANPKDVNDKWMADFAANFSNLQDA